MVNNPKYWVYNEAGSDQGKFNLLLYCNDNFYLRGGGTEVDHNRMNQSIHSIHARFAPEGEPDRTVTIVEGHRVFQNEQVVCQSSILIWVHSPLHLQSRRLRQNDKSFTDEEWSQNVALKIDILIGFGMSSMEGNAMSLNGLHPPKYNARLILSMMVTRRETGNPTIYRAVSSDDMFDEERSDHVENA